MRRREFVGTVAQAAAAVGVVPIKSMAGPSRTFAGWTWVHGGREREPAEWRERFARLRESGITGVLVSGGDTAILADAAHASGLTFHRWLWILNRNGDAWAQEHHPEWFTISRNGDSTLEKPPYVGYYKWVCPTRPPVRAYLQDLVGRVAEHPGVDGVHLDYIRFSDVILPIGLWEKYDLVQDREHAEFDFCYCDVCRATFQAQSGVDPMTLDDAPAHLAWRTFRWNTLTECVQGLARAVHARGKTITAAVFPTPSIARQLVRQAWDRWPLDAFFPMQYHSFYEEPVSWIAEATRAGVSALASGAPLHAGLYLPSLTPDELGAAAQLARDAGAAGVACFEMEGLTDAHLARLAEVFA